MRKISVTISVLKRKIGKSYKWIVWEIGNTSQGDFERRIVAYNDKKNAVSYMKRYSSKLVRQYGENIIVKLI